MTKLWAGLILTMALLAGTAASARADGTSCPWATTAAFPTMLPPGWYTNTYACNNWWHYPWYAYYNYSQGPYANWLLGKGVAGYANQLKMPPIPMAAQVTINLPEDAKLLFSGVVAEGNGDIRTFTTPVLALNQTYAYEMSVEVVRNKKTFRQTKLVSVHAGEEVNVIFAFPELKEVREEKATVLPPIPTKK